MILLRNLCHQLSIIASICLSATLTETATSELKLINVMCLGRGGDVLCTSLEHYLEIFRHGDRTPGPGEMYPDDPYVNSSFYPTGRGQLTLDGKRREYDLGRNLRSRYNNFLGSVYEPKDVEARSSDMERTKMSLQLALAGLYPPANIQRWNKQLNWQPIPTLYTPHVEDKLLLIYDCPEYNAEYERVLKTPEVQKIMSQFDELGKNLTKLTGKPMKNPWDFFLLYHTFMAESSLGLSIPEWSHSYFSPSSPAKGPLFDAIVAAYNIFSYTDLLKKYSAGPMIGAMIDNMRAKQNDSKPIKIYLYGAHELNIAYLLQAFQLYKPHVPEYSSAIITELHQKGSDYFVKFVYYTGIPPVFKELTIPGCELLCPFDKFLALTANLVPTDEEYICNKRKHPRYANMKYPAAVQELIYNLKNRNRL